MKNLKSILMLIIPVLVIVVLACVVISASGQPLAHLHLDLISNN